MLFITIGTILLIAGYVSLVAFFLYGWWKLKEFNGTATKKHVFITVIVPVRNEEKNIVHLLRDLKEQTYPADKYEVIIVDDHSTDQTTQKVMQAKMDNVRIISLGDAGTVRMNKKAGIQHAVSSAKGELIITTDADCHVGNKWISTIAAYYTEHEPVMIAGLVNYFPDATFFGKFQTLDFLSLVGIGAACIQNGFYNLCNGANLAYTKAAFEAVNGYEGVDHIPSGDDMMLMHKMARKFPGKIASLKNKDSIVYTHTETDVVSFWHQRVRWTSKSTHYEDKRITLILSFAYLFNLLIVFNMVIGFFVPGMLKLSMWMFLVKICIDTLFTYAVSRFFRRENILWLFLPIQALHVLYIIIIAPAGVFGKYQWKGRRH
ncbi:MAG TPA: glycosyltransferase [Chitinophagales bacterium]|nr:glycosyltransferase [Chitinophagales bacterium]HMX04764.1 glycosyltransferase [Chitinophagales bacterium]HMZ88826.1 glycosyltransferase [Chitinophagales bacterium]HNA59228.1 glycosyltransferase [Chitinophagales bacterium]HNE45984.1 glycosyltransferase [Chitinophagales bacterium]